MLCVIHGVAKSRTRLKRLSSSSSSSGSDHELLIAKFTLKEKVGKTTRTFKYDLNQIRYGYTVEVRNRFKGLDLIECLRTMDRGS